MRLLDHLVHDLSLQPSKDVELLKKFHHLRYNAGGNAACYIDIARRNAAYSGYDADATVVGSVKNAHMMGDDGDDKQSAPMTQEELDAFARNFTRQILAPIMPTDEEIRRRQAQVDSDADGDYEDKDDDIILPPPLPTDSDRNDDSYNVRGGEKRYRDGDDSDDDTQEKRARLNDEDEAQLSRLEMLPDELLFKIAYDLPLDTVSEFCRVSRRFAFICNDLSFWIERAKRNGLITDQHTIKTKEDYRNLMLAFREIFGHYFDGEKIHWNEINELYDSQRIIFKNGALKQASANGYFEIVRLLLENDAGAWENGYNYALDDAARHNHADIVRLLLTAGADANYDYAFDGAAGKGHANIMQLLLAHGAKLHQVGEGALISASIGGQPEIVRWLLSSGVDVHASNDVALYHASTMGYVDVVRVLLEYGANVHAGNDQALIAASTHRHVNVVKLLLENDANVHATDDYALRWASDAGHAQLVRLLLAHGADVHARNDEALRFARERGHDEVVAMLKEAANKPMRRIQQGVNQRPPHVMYPVEGDSTGNNNQTFLSRLRNLPRNLYNEIYLAPRVEEQYNESQDHQH